MVLCGPLKLGLASELKFTEIKNYSSYEDKDYTLSITNHSLYLKKMMSTKIFDFSKEEKIDLYSNVLSTCHLIVTKKFYDQPFVIPVKRNFYRYCIGDQVEKFYEGVESFLGYKDLNKVQVGEFLWDLKTLKREKKQINTYVSTFGPLTIETYPYLSVRGKDLFYEDSKKIGKQVFTYKQLLLIFEEDQVSVVDLLKKTTRVVFFKVNQVYDLGFVMVENSLGAYKLEGLD